MSPMSIASPGTGNQGLRGTQRMRFSRLPLNWGESGVPALQSLPPTELLHAKLKHGRFLSCMAREDASYLLRLFVQVLTSQPSGPIDI